MINGKRPLFSWEDTGNSAGNRPVANENADGAIHAPAGAPDSQALEGQ